MEEKRYLPTSLRHMTNVEAKIGDDIRTLIEDGIRREKSTNTITAVVYWLFDCILTELRPGPLALKTVVESARMMK